MIFGIKMFDNFDPYNVLLAIATNIHVRLMTSFVVQGHISYSNQINTYYSNLINFDMHNTNYIFSFYYKVTKFLIFRCCFINVLLIILNAF